MHREIRVEASKRFQRPLGARLNIDLPTDLEPTMLILPPLSLPLHLALGPPAYGPAYIAFPLARHLTGLRHSPSSFGPDTRGTRASVWDDSAL
jgi:hypothetical protein